MLRKIWTGNFDDWMLVARLGLMFALWLAGG
jgi:hypothetical protein